MKPSAYLRGVNDLKQVISLIKKHQQSQVASSFTARELLLFPSTLLTRLEKCQLILTPSDPTTPSLVHLEVRYFFELPF